MLESLSFLDTYFAVAAFILGTIVGSFLNVVIYRLHTGRSLQGSSHCLSCQHDLSWYELVPLISYIVLRGRCRECSSWIPVRYFVVELLAGLGFLAIFLADGSYIEMALTAALFALLLVIAVYDIYHFVIPNDLVLYVSIVAVATLGYLFYEGAALVSLLLDVLAGIAASAFFWFLWRVSDGRWIGFGDVKLAFPLGALAGSAGAFSMVVLSFWVGAVVSVFIICFQQLLERGQVRLRFFNAPLKMSSEVPFAPFLIAGFILSYFYGVDVLALIVYVL